MSANECVITQATTVIACSHLFCNISAASSQPSCQYKCCRFRLLQTTNTLKCYISTSCNFVFNFHFVCAYGWVRCSPKIIWLCQEMFKFWLTSLCQWKCSICDLIGLDQRVYSSLNCRFSQSTFLLAVNLEHAIFMQSWFLQPAKCQYVNGSKNQSES